MLDDVVLIDREFGDPTAAADFFSTTHLTLGALDGGFTAELSYALEMTSSITGDSFHTLAFLTAVPEPTTATLVLIGLIWIAGARRGRSARR